MAGDDVVLEIHGLDIALPPGSDREYAVRGFDVSVVRGETLCLVGESGSGKSMVANAVMGLLPVPHVRATAGTITFQGQNLLTASPEALRQLRARKIAMVFQDPLSALNPLMRIGDQLDEILRTHRPEISAADRQDKVVRALTDVELPNPEFLYRSYPFRLSGGQRQRVLIAAALLLEPELLIADEPTTALDVTTQAAILTLIRVLQAKKGTTVLFITHDFGVVSEIADRVVVMRHGEAVERGTIDQVIGDPQHEYTQRLIAAIPTGEDFTQTDALSTEVAVRLDSVQKRYYLSRGLFRRGKPLDALDGVSLEIHEGEILGLVGESGSGKSTLGRCLAGLDKTDGGRILHLYETPQTATGARRRSSPVQMVFQDPFSSLNPRHKIGTTLIAGLRADGVPQAAAMKRVQELLELVGLSPEAVHRYPHEFSGGQRQRIGIARALAVDPRLIVADEPVSALDVLVQDQVLDLFASINRDLGVSILFITHDLKVAARMCHNIAVLQRGRLVEYGLAWQVMQDPHNEYTRQLLASIPRLRGKKTAAGASPAATPMAFSY